MTEPEKDPGEQDLVEVPEELRDLKPPTLADGSPLPAPGAVNGGEA